jgi:hypothetical protein
MVFAGYIIKLADDKQALSYSKDLKITCDLFDIHLDKS